MKNTLQVLSLNEKLKNSENFQLHPQVVFESQFVAIGNDIEKKEQTDKFTKRLRAMMRDMNLLHELHSNIMNSLKDFKVYYKLVNSNFGYSILAQQYALLEKSLKNYNKFVKSQKHNPEILTLCEEFNDLVEINVFEMMLSDLDVFKDEVENRIKQHSEKYPDFKPRSEVSSEVDFEKIKKAYKKK